MIIVSGANLLGRIAETVGADGRGLLVGEHIAQCDVRGAIVGQSYGRAVERFLVLYHNCFTSSVTFGGPVLATTNEDADVFIREFYGSYEDSWHYVCVVMSHEMLPQRCDRTTLDVSLEVFEQRLKHKWNNLSRAGLN